MSEFLHLFTTPRLDGGNLWLATYSAQLAETKFKPRITGSMVSFEKTVDQPPICPKTGLRPLAQRVRWPFSKSAQHRIATE